MREQLVQFFRQHWVTILKFIQQDQPGEALADYLMFGGHLNPMNLGLLRDMVGKDRIMQVIRETPEAWAEVQPIAPQFEKLLDGFLGWKEGWDDEEEEAPPPVTVPIDRGRPQ